MKLLIKLQYTLKSHSNTSFKCVWFHLPPSSLTVNSYPRTTLTQGHKAVHSSPLLYSIHCTVLH